jgi:hypothetical protein
MPGTEQDPYEILGVSRTATPDEIRAAYRTLAARYHPDKHKGNPLESLAAEKLRQINMAYEKVSAGAPGISEPPPARSGGTNVVRVVLVLLGVALLLRFATGLIAIVVRPIFVVLRGLFGAVRGSPVALIAFVFLLALALRWALGKRRR